MTSQKPNFLQTVQILLCVMLDRHSVSISFSAEQMPQKGLFLFVGPPNVYVCVLPVEGVCVCVCARPGCVFVAYMCICGFWCGVSSHRDQGNQVRDILTFPNGSSDLLGLFQHLEDLKKKNCALKVVIGQKEFHLNRLVLKHFILLFYQILIIS